MITGFARVGPNYSSVDGHVAAQENVSEFWSAHKCEVYQTSLESRMKLGYYRELKVVACHVTENSRLKELYCGMYRIH